MNLQNVEFIRSCAAVSDCPRDGLPQIVFSGRSNVGKSSVINRLLRRKNFARVGSMPGKTVQLNFFKIDGAMYFVDIPGYGYAKVSEKERARWAKMIDGYLSDPALMTFGVMIVDARHKPTENDCTMAQYFAGTEKPFCVVANKLDKLKKSEIEPNLARIRETLELPESVKVIPFSAETGTGREELLRAILDAAEVTA
ncbi:MAG: YihA family ribosome biogenesis GTP-binding protein [Oscillospiraceae bacterium]|nr:YihA family ribosome biogenesis GTP-binding protein [Oscillospiraceae bacterium]